jgi:hypothetical protein
MPTVCRVLLTMILLPNIALSKQGMPIQSTENQNWLHPSDGDYQIAINAAFPHKRDKKEVKILHFENRLQMDPFSRFIVNSPLACAFNVANSKQIKLEEPPSIEDVKHYCDGRLEVVVTHFSVNLSVKRPVIIQHAGQTVRPTSDLFDELPQVTTYIAGMLNSDQVGYRYVDVHTFTVDSAWNDSVMFVTADEYGAQKTLTFDFGKFEKNEMEFRGQNRK